MLQLKDFGGGRSVGGEGMSWDGKILKELEGLPGGRAWFAITLLFGGRHLRFRADWDPRSNVVGGEDGEVADKGRRSLPPRSTTRTV